MILEFKYLLKRSIVKIENSSSKILGNGKIIHSKIKITGNNNIITIEDGAVLKGSRISIKGDNNNIYIGKNCSLHKLGIFMEDSNSKVTIGEKTTCAQIKMVAIEGAKIEIGKNCMFSYNIEMRNADSHKIYTCKDKSRVNFPKDIIIGDNVWISMGCIILKGCKIGDGSIIGAGSVVSRAIRENSIAVGVPAKEIKEGVFWER